MANETKDRIQEYQTKDKQFIVVCRTICTNGLGHIGLSKAIATAKATNSEFF